MLENSNKEFLFNYVDEDYRRARVNILVSWNGIIENSRFSRDVEASVKSIFPSDAVKITGITAFMSRTLDMVISTLYRSYLAAGISITLFMIILFASFKLGMISMLPNFLPIIYGLGFMSFLDISLNMTTLMVGSISLGLVVDDTIHFFLQNFEDYFKKKRTQKKPLKRLFWV